MRVQFVITLAVGAGLASAPVAAQNQVASATQNQAATAADQKAAPAKSRKANKPAAGDKICKRLSQGKVCLTAEKWKAYEEQF